MKEKEIHLAVTVQNEAVGCKAAVEMMNELSATLEMITGSSGTTSFSTDDMQDPRALFVIARTSEGTAVGCGAFRPMNDSTAEIKRMYAKEKGRGIGALILSHLEREAKQMGYSRIWLETRRINENAVQFYKDHGYQCIPNYGKYAGNALAICFEKKL
ncbi:MAG: hypothetical protein PWP51_2608 [Clostridiales bacterium]|nr:hypothetical protein [Clostridiales bacterium]